MGAGLLRNGCVEHVPRLLHGDDITVARSNRSVLRFSPCAGPNSATSSSRLPARDDLSDWVEAVSPTRRNREFARAPNGGGDSMSGPSLCRNTPLRDRAAMMQQ